MRRSPASRLMTSPLHAHERFGRQATEDPGGGPGTGLAETLSRTSTVVSGGMATVPYGTLRAAERRLAALPVVGAGTPCPLPLRWTETREAIWSRRIRGPEVTGAEGGVEAGALHGAGRVEDGSSTEADGGCAAGDRRRRANERHACRVAL